MMTFEDWSTLSPEELNELYKKYNIKEIGEMFGVTFNAVAYRIRTYGLKGNGKHPSGPSAKFKPDRDELNDLIQKMSMKDVAKHYGVGDDCRLYEMQAIWHYWSFTVRAPKPLLKGQTPRT